MKCRSARRSILHACSILLPGIVAALRTVLAGVFAYFPFLTNQND